ncbi:MAG: hypothetical protein EPO55_09430 [Reyranella sp.]|uniref:DUF6884 domain-containing protein n=1 Tax=Reyranella sp. TaxID=1929291 RepID=UPI00120A5CA4|nr:DUF6884 domain-containing protein [Reyranella sp.]TAJ40215.1 MAG: hypothetical protein EPO55_09430 [Reyranella sp.]
MASLALVACSKTKAAEERPAAALYTSPLFRKSLLHSLGKAKTTAILSAKHGVLPLSVRVTPYDMTLKDFDRHQRAEWSAMVAHQLKDVISSGDIVALYCGSDYYKPLQGVFAQLGCKVELPLGRLSLGSRLQALRRFNDDDLLNKSGSAFYKLMRKLYVAQGGGRLLAEASGRLSWPTRGIYFFIEDTEPTLSRVPRVTRVGTHAVSKGSRTTLWDRLSTHRGTNQGIGSHRSSIFRLHVGRALTTGLSNAARPRSWAEGQTASGEIRKGEEQLERRVSAVIGAMRVLWLDVPDDAGPLSDRAYLEQNCIGLLSRWYLSAGQKGAHWLGNSSEDWRIAVSGLWNLNCLFNPPDTRLFEVLETYVEATIGLRSMPEKSISPKDWRKGAVLLRKSPQLSLF